MEFHPIANRYPLLEGAERAAFKEDVRVNGLRQATLWRYEGKILDGRNRFTICDELGTTDQIYWADYEGDDPEGFVHSLNRFRRHLDADARRLVVADLRSQGKSVRTIATELGLPKSTVQNDLSAGSELGVPSGTPAAPLTGEVTGKDGKKYPARKPRKKKDESAESLPNGEHVENQADSPAAFVRRMNALCLALDAAAAEVEAIGKEPLGYALHWSSAQTNIKNARTTIHQGKPAHDCPYCDAKGCKACHQTGRVKSIVHAEGVEAKRGAKG